jgi:acyl-CoA thioesterase
MWAADDATRALGIVIEDVGAGRCTMAMDVRPEMVNGHKICHGGYMFLIADTAMAFASNSHGIRAVAQQAAISFIAPARLGDRLVAHAVERSRVGRTSLYDVTVLRHPPDGEEPETVAEFRGHTRTIKGSWDGR